MMFHRKSVMFFLLGAAASSALRKRGGEDQLNLNNAEDNSVPATTPASAASAAAGATCADSIPINVDDIVTGTFVPMTEEEYNNGKSHPGVWYTIMGTGGYLSATTCTGDEVLANNGLDTVIYVIEETCDNDENYNYIAYDDDMGECGYLKSKAVFPTTAGQVYYIKVYPLSMIVDPQDGFNNFALTVMEYVPEPGSMCELATPLELGQEITQEVGNGAQQWFEISAPASASGMPYLAIKTCVNDFEPTEEGMSVSTYQDVYSGTCIENIYVASNYGNENSCTFSYVENTEAVYHIAVTAYINYYYYGDGYSEEGEDVPETTEENETPITPTYTITLYEVDELPNNVCQGAKAMEMGDVITEEESVDFGMRYYSFYGTGNDIIITTCTGDVGLDGNDFDSIITLYARDCNDLRHITSDDEGGKCGHGKSRITFSSVSGLLYTIELSSYNGGMAAFGLTIFEDAAADSV